MANPLPAAEALTECRSIPDGTASRSLAGGLGRVQGAFYVATGLWPLVHIDSFQAVTGPKTDLWLVQTVGVLIAIVGVVLLAAAGARRITPEVVILAVGTALGLAAVDVIFVARGVILPVYLADAAAEGALAAGWLWAVRRL